MAHGRAKFERLVATPCLRSRGRGRDWRFFGKNALTEDRAGEEEKPLAGETARIDACFGVELDGEGRFEFVVCELLELVVRVLE